MGEASIKSGRVSALRNIARQHLATFLNEGIKKGRKGWKPGGQGRERTRHANEKSNTSKLFAEHPPPPPHTQSTPSMANDNEIGYLKNKTNVQ